MSAPRIVGGIVAIALSAAATASAATPVFRVQAEVGRGLHLVGGSRATVVGAAMSLPFWDDVAEFTWGLRGAFAPGADGPLASAFARTSMVVGSGLWSAALGLEVEGGDSPPGEYIHGSLEERYTATGADFWRALVVVEPLRFEVSRLFVSAATLRFGTTLGSEAGRRLFANVGIVAVGWGWP